MGFSRHWADDRSSLTQGRLAVGDLKSLTSIPHVPLGRGPLSARVSPQALPPRAPLLGCRPSPDVFGRGDGRPRKNGVEETAGGQGERWGAS